MSRQDQDQPRASGSQQGTRDISHLTLSMSRPYEKLYERRTGERNPQQSGFVSSSTWTTGDTRWYRAQTLTLPSNDDRTTQDSKVTSSGSDDLQRAFRALID